MLSLYPLYTASLLRVNFHFRFDYFRGTTLRMTYGMKRICGGSGDGDGDGTGILSWRWGRGEGVTLNFGLAF